MISPLATKYNRQTDNANSTINRRLHDAARNLVQMCGGDEGLAHRFAEQGLIDLFSAWAAGRQQKITPHQLHAVIGRNLLSCLAELADLSLAQTLAGLADYLPTYVTSTLKVDSLEMDQAVRL